MVLLKFGKMELGKILAFRNIYVENVNHPNEKSMILYFFKLISIFFTGNSI